MGRSEVYAAAPLTPPLSDEELPAGESLSAKQGLSYERKMGDTELSYFLPSRQTGVNDMYVL